MSSGKGWMPCKGFDISQTNTSICLHLVHLKIKVLHNEDIAQSRRLWASFGSCYSAQFCHGWLGQKVSKLKVTPYKIDHIL